LDVAWLEHELGSHVVRIERIQSLWNGYGELNRVVLETGPVIVKWARPPSSATAKRASYANELAFYERVRPTSRVPKLLASRVTDEWMLVLEDLDAAGFPRRTAAASGRDLDAVLRWLAELHVQFLGTSWPMRGTYWHLDARRDELAAIDNPILRRTASELDARLQTAKYQTLVHGDAKDENFCFSTDHRVAAVDFQYVGYGPGIVDVAYLLHGRSNSSLALDAYCRLLPSEVAEEWRALYPIAQRDFERFLAGWRR
jgi:aminoglycoside/choline kinase family phosphotransferase